MKKGDILQLKIDSVTYGSEGIAREDGRIIFVDRTLPSEEVEVAIVKKRRDYAVAKIVSFQKTSKQRIEAQCTHFGTCGGCKWQDVNYDYQLELKQQIVQDTMQRLGGFSDVQINPIIPSPEVFCYRNKMEFSFASHRWILPGESDTLLKPKDFSLGFHIPKRYDKVLDIDKCWLQSDWKNSVLNEAKDSAIDSGFPPWDSKTHSGFWRYLVLKEGKNTGQKMVNIVTFEHKPGLMKSFSEKLLSVIPDLTSIVNNVKESTGGSAFGEKEYLLHGSSTIEERIGDCVFEISANSFFQTNTRQAENLFKITRDFASLTEESIVYDLYAGTGTISIFLSPYAKKVVGIELVESAVENAQDNAVKNKVTNCEFVLGDMKDILGDVASFSTQHGKPDVIIVDPPRVGMHPKSVSAILALQPTRIVYVSCNPTTFARDASLLCNSDYSLIQIQPVDMFPHTYHIELVGQFELKPTKH